MTYTDNFPNAGFQDWLYPPDKRAERDPLEMARVKDLSGLTVYLDCGSSDDLGFYKGAAALDRLLRERGVPSEYHENAGRHDSTYWMTHAGEYLLFYAGR